MGLILGSSIQKLMIGYPTLTDKDVSKGGTLESGEVHYGELVKFGTNAGEYKPVTAASPVTAVSEYAGVVLGTNVKISGKYPDNDSNTLVKANQAFNLMFKGGIAVKLASTAVLAEVVEGAQVYVTLDGQFTTTSDATTGVAALATINLKAKFTGVVETQGSVKVAEIILC